MSSFLTKWAALLAPEPSPVAPPALPVPPEAKPTHTPALPQTEPTETPAAKHARLAQTRGHCGTCRHFTPSPSEGRYMGVCALGWAAHEPYRAASREDVVMNEAARCMTVARDLTPSPRWAAKAGIPTEVNA